MLEETSSGSPPSLLKMVLSLLLLLMVVGVSLAYTLYQWRKLSHKIRGQPPKSAQDEAKELTQQMRESHQAARRDVAEELRSVMELQTQVTGQLAQLQLALAQMSNQGVQETGDIKQD